MLVTSLILAAALVVLAAAGVLWVHFDERRTPRLLCLMYHRFVTAGQYATCRGTEAVFCLPIEAFEAQLARLKDLGYHSVTAQDAVDFLLRRRSLPQPAVLITIDDGCRSVLTLAEPALRKHGLSAVLFVTVDPRAPVFDDADQRRLSEQELRSLDPGVVDVQAHGLTHAPLVALSDEALQRELHESKNALAQSLGRSVTRMAVPGNWHNARVLRHAREAGYDAVFVSDAGTNRPGRNPLRIRRVNVEGWVDLDTFVSNLAPKALAQIRVASTCKRLPGRLLGPTIWLPLRGRIRSVIRPELLSFESLRRAIFWLPFLLIAGLLLWWWVDP